MFIPTVLISVIEDYLRPQQRWSLDHYGVRNDGNVRVPRYELSTTRGYDGQCHLCKSYTIRSKFTWGMVFTECNYKNNQRHGLLREWVANSHDDKRQLREQSHYKHDQLHGIQLTWSRRDQCKAEYCHGKRLSVVFTIHCREEYLDE